MKPFKLAGAIPALALGLAVASPASASLIGDEVTLTILEENLIPTEQTETVADPGVEFTTQASDTLAGDIFEFDLDANSITMTNIWDGLLPNGNTFGDGTVWSSGDRLKFSGLDWTDRPGRITAVDVAFDGVRSIGDDTEFRIDFGDDYVEFIFDDNFDGTFISSSKSTGSANNTTEFDVGGTITANLTVAPVPLPAAGWLLLSAFGGLGVMARRRRKAA